MNEEEENLLIQIARNWIHRLDQDKRNSWANKFAKDNGLESPLESVLKKTKKKQKKYKKKKKRATKKEMEARKQKELGDQFRKSVNSRKPLGRSERSVVSQGNLSTKGKEILAIVQSGNNWATDIAESLKMQTTTAQNFLHVLVGEGYLETTQEGFYELTEQGESVLDG